MENYIYILAFIENKLRPNIIDLPELREKIHVFQDRAHAGKVLAEMLKYFTGSPTTNYSTLDKNIHICELFFRNDKSNRFNFNKRR